MFLKKHAAAFRRAACIAAVLFLAAPHPAQAQPHRYDRDRDGRYDRRYPHDRDWRRYDRRVIQRQTYYYPYGYPPPIYAPPVVVPPAYSYGYGYYDAPGFQLIVPLTIR